MPLGTAALKTGIQDLHAELYANAANLTSAQAGERYATRMSELFEIFVKSGDGMYQTGTLIAGANPVTGVGVLPNVKIQ